MIRDFGSFTRRGCWWTLGALLKYGGGGDLSQTEQGGGRDWREDGRRQKDHRPACGERVVRTQRLSLIAGDTNDPQCLGLHSVKLRKVKGRSTSPEVRAVLHQAVDESFVPGQELRCAKEGLGTMEDAQSATGFGGQLGNVAFPGKIVADSEAQKLQ